jgi:sulfite reductase (NADPH) flavoprotein alpha-component
LDAQEAANARYGHENEGFLSVRQGYLPIAEPLLRLSPEFAAWDAAAAELPALYRAVGVRKQLNALPLLDASSASLPQREVLRACALLAMLGHAYWYSEPRPPTALPESIGLPWRQLRARLGREQQVLSYIDLIVYNWRFSDPLRSTSRTVEQLDLLFPTIGNREERVFYLTQLEILAETAPILSLVADAQTSVLRHDDRALAHALEAIGSCLQRVVTASLRKIDPRPSSDTYVDPVVWAKTVAPFAVPFEQGMQGPSGTSSPLFSTLDVFFGRQRHASVLGREMLQLRAGYPPAWRGFLAALARVSVASYVAECADPLLEGLWHETFQRYAGPDGFLDRHRMKVYGYLELAFKVGRTLTIGGFSGAFTERTWDEVDTALRQSHDERRSP